MSTDVDRCDDSLQKKALSAIIGVDINLGRII